MKRMLILLAILVLIPVLYIGGFIIYGTITRFRPAPVEDVPVVKASAGNSPAISINDTLTFMTWNIGYGGLGAETDFFYDSGKMVTTPEAWVKKYTDGIDATVRENQDADFIFIQEADRKGKRSWNIDEVAGISSAVPDHNYAFALNFNVQYLPFPYLNPIGKVYGGILSCTRFMPVESKRIALPGITDWPRKLFYLERCLLMQRFKLPNGKDFVVINTHFEAYDDGSVKKEQMKLTKKILEDEYAKGNYVILGGDWNIAPPDFNVKKWEKEINHDKLYEMNNDSNYIPHWKYAYDGNTPSNRKNSHPFDPNTTFTTVIDYFFVSPNIEVIEVKGINAGFEYSDHNPVRLRMKFITEQPKPVVDTTATAADADAEGSVKTDDAKTDNDKETVKAKKQEAKDDEAPAPKKKAVKHKKKVEDD
jgi:endonuclease/exonuclease/phosphatase family metal-dependent hydrolase